MTEALKFFLFGIIGYGIVIWVVYFLSRIQMKAWIKELDNQLDNKIRKFKTIKTDEKEQE